MRYKHKLLNMKNTVINTLLFSTIIAFSLQLKAQHIETREDAILFLNKYLLKDVVMDGWRFFYLREENPIASDDNQIRYAMYNYKLENEFLIFTIKKELSRHYDASLNYFDIKYGKTQQFLIDLTDSICLRKGKKNEFISYKNYWIEGVAGPAKNIKTFYDAIARLKSNFDSKEKEEFKINEFKEGKLNNKEAVISEEQRKYIVQANKANDEKDYENALLLYRKALKVNPYSYPDAYFNMALIQATSDNYYQAVNLMKRYLILAPESEDARSAQDKIYEWELNIKN